MLLPFGNQERPAIDHWKWTGVGYVKKSCDFRVIQNESKVDFLLVELQVRKINLRKNIFNELKTNNKNKYIFYFSSKLHCVHLRMFLILDSDFPLSHPRCEVFLESRIESYCYFQFLA